MPVKELSPAGARPGRPGELLEVEGVPAALFVDARDVDLFAEQLPSLVARQRADLDAGHLRRTVRSLEGGREPFGHRAGTVRQLR